MGQSRNQSKEESVGSAELINVSQQQKHRSLQTTVHWTTPLIYWLAIMNLMQSSTFSTSALNNCLRPTLTAVDRKALTLNQMNSVSTSPNWNRSKTWFSSKTLQTVHSIRSLWVLFRVTPIWATNRPILLQMHLKTVHTLMITNGNKHFANSSQIWSKPQTIAVVHLCNIFSFI